MKIPTLNLTWLIRYWLSIMMMFHSYHPIFVSDMVGFTQYIDSLGVPIPEIIAYIVKFSEFFGGLFLLFHFQTRLFSALIMIVMAVASFFAHKGLILTEGELAFNYFILATILFFNPGISFRIVKPKLKKNED